MALVYKGLVRRGYISGVPYVYPAVRFEYKALWPEFRREVFEQIRKQPGPEESDAFLAALMERSLVAWNIRVPDDWESGKIGDLKPGDAVPITKDVIQNHIEPAVFVRIHKIILGLSASDIDPEDMLEQQIKTGKEQGLSSEEFLKKLTDEDSQQVKN